MLESQVRWFIGCACDRNYVEHTAVTLASIDMNGNVPEAEVLVAGFGLSAADRATLRAGAGRLSLRMRIIDITPAMLNGLNGEGWAHEYPLAVLGRLFLPDVVQGSNARLITIDSDMIVNVSLRPLFQLRLFGSFLAACHDVPRHDDLNYFNSGLMVIDVDGYKRHDISVRSLQWLAEQETPPKWPDQDALNVVVGHIWYRLDHRWNFHCNYAKPRAIITADYEEAFIAHFAASKPWNDVTHPGLPLYRRYRDELDRRIHVSEAIANHADPAFIATAFEILLGREPDGDAEYLTYSRFTASELIRRLVNSTRFVKATLLPLVFDDPFEGGRFGRELTSRHKLWAADRLHLLPHTVDRLGAAETWREFLLAIIGDPDFRRKTGSAPLLALAEGVMLRR